MTSEHSHCVEVLAHENSVTFLENVGLFGSGEVTYVKPYVKPVPARQR